MNNYYVYTWTDPRVNEIFYIGKGIGNRAYNIHHNLRCENKRKRILQQGYSNDDIVLIPHKNLSEEEALQIEEQLINKHKIIEEGGTLFNYRIKGLKSGSWQKVRSKDDIIKICHLYSEGYTMFDLGKMYNVHETTIRKYLQDNNITIRCQGYTTPLPTNWDNVYNNIKTGKLSKRKAYQSLNISWPTLIRLINETDQLCGIVATN